MGNTPVGKMRQGELKVQTDAYDLAVYILNIITNPNNFPPELSDKISTVIVQTALQICIDIYHANEIRVDSIRALSKRLSLQDSAHKLCGDLLVYINIIAGATKMRRKRYGYWTGLVEDLKKHIENWSNSDRQRYSNIQQK